MHIPGYQIERELGQGGMAIVYLALQESLQRRVALKVIKPILTTDEEFAQRFLREGRIIAQLNDPHIVTVYDIASHEGNYYLAMEYLPGATLQQRIRDGLPLPDAMRAARAIASALHYAHQRGVIHRDIKPQNILFRENDQPVLTDFGIAKTLGGSTIMTRTGLSLGTPRYMSPEQIRGQEVDGRADLYSLGVLFYEMLTGNVPYAAEDSFALAMMHVTAPVPDLPMELSRYQPLLNKLLEKDPRQRFQTGQEFITALDHPETLPATLDLGDLTRSDAVAAPSVAGARRSRWTAGAVAAALAALTLAGGGYWYQSRLASESPPSSAATAPAVQPTSGDPALQRRTAVEALLVQARQRQQAGGLADSRVLIEQGLAIEPGQPDLLALRETLDRQTEAERSRKAQEEQRLQAEFQAEQALEQAQQARQQGELDLGLIHVEQGLRVLPSHAGLLALRRELQEQQARRQARDAAARQQALLAELRKTEQARLRAEAEEQRQAEQARLRLEAEQRRVKANEFLAWALEAQRKGSFETSLLHIEQGLQQESGHGRLLALRKQVNQQLREATAPPSTPTAPPEEPADWIADRLRQCAGHLQAKRFVGGGKGGNAADCYASVLRREPDNAEARAGLDQIGDHYADLATEAVRNGDVRGAKNALDRWQRLDRDDPRLADLRERIARLQPPASPPPSPPVRPVAEVEPSSKTQASKPEPPKAEPMASAPARQPPSPTETPVSAESLPKIQAPPKTAKPAKAESPPPSELSPISLVSNAAPVEPAPSSAAVSSVAKPREAEQERARRMAKIESAESLNQPVLTVPQPPGAPAGSEPVSRAQRPSAGPVWDALKASEDPAAIEQFLASYPRSRQASAARARLKQLRQQPATPARLLVRANQEGAEVSINGQPAGAVPLDVELKPGSYQIQVRREGFDDWNGQVHLEAGDESKITVPLLRQQAQAAVQPAAAPARMKLKPDAKPESKPEAPPEIELQSPRERPGASQTVASAAAPGRTSCLQGNCREGQGVYRHPDGSEYAGEFHNAKMHGQGTYLYQKRGEKYVGEWRDNQINGQGVFYYRSGNQYDGEWRNGRKHGQGTYTYANGDKYVGEFADDEPHGQGAYYYRNGDRYEGEWRNGHKEGQGVMYENGQRLVGQWRNDQKIQVRLEK